MISDVVRPAFEDVFSRKESFTEAFNVTGLYPFNPQAPDRSKLHPGDQYQPSEDSPGDIRDVKVDVTALLHWSKIRLTKSLSLRG